ncbi:hypothetical protein N8077_04925 [Myxococcota bacterium]|nr:hypothetical protein [Myxococcota bacterium]
MSDEREYYAGIEIGVTRSQGEGRVLTAADIKRFAFELETMLFNTDEKAAEASILGRLCASSVHVLALGSQLAHEGQAYVDASSAFGVSSSMVMSAP